MADTTWTEEQATGPKKRRIPSWAWFCGGGCLLAVLITVVTAGLVIRHVTDTEGHWKRLALILPYDERPEQMKLIMGIGLFGDQYTFDDSRGFQEQIQDHPGANNSEARKRMFDSKDPLFPKNMAVIRFEDIASGTVEVQGRELRLLRMRMKFAGMIEKMIPEKDREEIGAMAFVDLTPEGREGMLLLQITRQNGPEPITDEEIREILAPFHVGPQR